MKLIVYNKFDFLRYGIYLEALTETLDYSLSFSNVGFIDSNLNIMLVIVDSYRIVIDTDDRNEICRSSLDWCDNYGKANINSGDIANSASNKVVALPPPISARPRNGREQFIKWILSNPLRRAGETDLSECCALAWQFKRANWEQSALKKYHPTTSLDSYLYYRVTYWAKHPNEGNRHRYLFFKASAGMFKKCSIGFVAGKGSLPKEYSALETKTRDSHGRYINETQRSTIVFNTPSTYGANSWRLSEYLALGKAIISTPILNRYVVPLEHGVNIHFVEPTEESIGMGIRFLLDHPEYRRMLEKNAREYWLKYCNPVRAIEIMLAHRRNNESLHNRTSSVQGISCRSAGVNLE